MSVQERIAQVIAQLPDGIARNDDTASAVWRLDDPSLLGRDRRVRSQSVESARRQILAVVLAAPENVFILHGDSPESEGVPGSWLPIAKHQWQLAANLDLADKATGHWLLSLGNWTIYSASTAVQTAWPDLFRIKPAELISWMASNRIPVLIAALPDSTEWIVALEHTGERTIRSVVTE